MKIPARFRGKGFKDFEEEKQPVAYQKALDFYENVEENIQEGRGLYLHGPNGTGKTHLAFAIAGNVMKNGSGADTYNPRTGGMSSKCLIYPVSDLLQDLKPGDFSDEVRQDTQQCDLLILDDFLRCRLTEWGSGQIVRLIDYRYNWQKSTIYTANVPPWKIVERTGESLWQAVVDRIAETCEVIEMDGETYRMEGNSHEG